jgi:hypothetical protein
MIKLLILSISMLLSSCSAVSGVSLLSLRCDVASDLTKDAEDRIIKRAVEETLLNLKIECD